MKAAALGLLLLVANAHGAEDASTPLMLETFSGGLAGWVSSSVDKYTGTHAPGGVHRPKLTSLHTRQTRLRPPRAC